MNDIKMKYDSNEISFEKRQKLFDNVWEKYKQQFPYMDNPKKYNYEQFPLKFYYMVHIAEGWPHPADVIAIYEKCLEINMPWQYFYTDECPDDVIL